MTKQPPPAPPANAVRPCPTIIQIIGRPGTGSLPRTIAPPDHPLSKSSYKCGWEKWGDNNMRWRWENICFCFKKKSLVQLTVTRPCATKKFPSAYSVDWLSSFLPNPYFWIYIYLFQTDWFKTKFLISAMTLILTSHHPTAPIMRQFAFLVIGLKQNF